MQDACRCRSVQEMKSPGSQVQDTCCTHPLEHVTQNMEKDPPLTWVKGRQVRALWAFLHFVFFILCKDTVFLFPLSTKNTRLNKHLVQR